MIKRQPKKVVSGGLLRVINLWCYKVKWLMAADTIVFRFLVYMVAFTTVSFGVKMAIFMGIGGFHVRRFSANFLVL